MKFSKEESEFLTCVMFSFCALFSFLHCFSMWRVVFRPPRAETKVEAGVRSRKSIKVSEPLYIFSSFLLPNFLLLLH